MHPYLVGVAKPAHVSHRGGSALWPENTLVAFEGAVRDFRTDVLELDVHLSKDGQVVVSHDPTLERCTDGRGAIAELTWAELAKLDAGARFTRDGATFPYAGRGVRLPRFEDVLTAFPGTRLNVEVKPRTPGLVSAFVALVRSHRALDRVCMGSEQDDVAAALVEAAPDGCHFFPRLALTEFVVGVAQGSAAPPDSRFHVLDMPAEFEGVPLLTPAFLEAARTHQRPIFVWTIDTAAEQRALLEAGVAGVMTDRPDVLRQVIDAWAQGHPPVRE